MKSILFTLMFGVFACTASAPGEQRVEFMETLATTLSGDDCAKMATDAHALKAKHTDLIQRMKVVDVKLSPELDKRMKVAYRTVEESILKCSSTPEFSAAISGLFL